MQASAAGGGFPSTPAPETEPSVTDPGKGCSPWGSLSYPLTLPRSHSLDALPICSITAPDKEQAGQTYL